MPPGVRVAGVVGKAGVVGVVAGVGGVGGVGVRGGVLLAVDGVPSTIWVLFIKFNFFHEFNSVSWLVLTIKSSL